MGAAIIMLGLMILGMGAVLWYGIQSKVAGADSERKKQLEVALNEISRARIARNNAGKLPIDSDPNNLDSKL